jgi:hypothetical protein
MLACAAVVVAACSRPAPHRPPPPPPFLQGHVATWVGRDTVTPSAAPVATASAGVHGLRVDGRVPSPCARMAPLVSVPDKLSRTFLVRVSLYVPALCDTRGDVFAFTAVAEGVPPGAYPVRVVWEVDDGSPRHLDARRVLLEDTVRIAEW